MAYIVELVADNVKRLRAVELHVGKGVVTIGGRNAQGKTSLLDAIAMAIGGESLVPPEPVRRGTNGGQVSVKLDDGLVVRRVFTMNGKSTLTVESSDGVRVRSPQTLLDGMLGKISFDPLAFMRLKPKEQAEMLRKLAGVDTTLLDGRRLKAYEDRTEISREVKRLDGALSKMPIIDGPTPEPVSVDALAAELNARRRANEARASKEVDVERLRDKKKRKDEDIQKLKADIERLGRQLAEAEQQLVEIKTSGKKSLAELDATPAANEDEILAQIRNLDAVNELARAAAARKAIEQELEAKRCEVTDLTEIIQRIDDQKRELLASSKLPVAGLTFDADEVRFNEIPIEQASSAEQIRISATIGLAMNPKLKVLRIYNGSLLDADSMAVLEKLAQANDAQIWIERVGDGDMSVIIEDGAVVGDGKNRDGHVPERREKKEAKRAREPGDEG